MAITEEIRILSTETQQADAFVEQICQHNHLYNYFGSISVAVSMAMGLVDNEVELTFEQCVGGVIFALNCQEGQFKDIANKDHKDLDNNALFIIDSLADATEVKNEGRTLELVFLVGGIEPELAMRRNEVMKKYSSVQVLA